MKPRHAAALALVGWYLMVVPTTTNAQASPTSTASRKVAHVWPTVSQAQAGAVDPDAVVPEAREAHRRSEAAIAANQWVLKVPHVTGMSPTYFLDESAAPKRVIKGGIRVWVFQPNHIREVEHKVPSQLDGLRVVVEVVVWCLSVSLGNDVPKHCSKCLEGKDVAKDCSDCAVTGEEAHSCEKEFKTKAQCESGGAKYMKDWDADADKNGDMVIIAPTTDCWELINPVKSHWDPITEKAVPDNQ